MLVAATCIFAYLGWLNTLVQALLAEKIDSVHALGTRHDLLASHEDIVRVGEARVIRTRHGVERPHLRCASSACVCVCAYIA